MDVVGVNTNWFENESLASSKKIVSVSSTDRLLCFDANVNLSFQDGLLAQFSYSDEINFSAKPRISFILVTEDMLYSPH